MKRPFAVTWCFDVEVEAESKYEAEELARQRVLTGHYGVTMPECVDTDPLQITELDENGDPIQ